MSKEKYSDYFIKEGKFIGAFEDMYRNVEDPWHQSTREAARSEKIVALNLLRKLKAGRVLELGCGLGFFTQQIHDLNVEVLGVDVSETAVRKAQANFPDCRFTVADILDRPLYLEWHPDVIIMAEVTWCILDKLDEFLAFYKEHLPKTHLIHLLATYPPGVQKYGADKFTNLKEIMAYFKMNYLEWGEIQYADLAGSRTYFLGRW